MSALQYPVINGIRYDWSSSVIKVDATEVGGVKEADYSGALEPTALYGNRAIPIGVTRGKYTAEAKISVYKAEAMLLLALLAAKGATMGAGFMEVFFGMEFSYAEAMGIPITDYVDMCRIKKQSDKGGEGGEPLFTEFELFVARPVRPNGLSPLGPRQMIR